LFEKCETGTALFATNFTDFSDLPGRFPLKNAFLKILNERDRCRWTSWSAKCLTLSKFKSESGRLTDRLEILQKGLTSAVMKTGQTVLERAKTEKLLLKSGSPIERRNFLDKLLSNPILDFANVRLTLKKPFGVLVEMKNMLIGAPGRT
jgi:hypothetical protein